MRAGYGGAERLHGVSCEVRAGRLTALIGPNGCGKSTLLKCAAGLLKPSGGAVYVGGYGRRFAFAEGAGVARVLHAAVAADACRFPWSSSSRMGAIPTCAGGEA